jgi:ribosomal protein L31E
MNFDSDSVQNETLKNIFDVLLKEREKIGGIKDIILSLQDNDNAVRMVSRLATEDIAGEKLEIFNDCLQDIYKRDIKKKQEDLQLSIKNRETKGEDISDLLSKFQSLIKEAKTKGCM